MSYDLPSACDLCPRRCGADRAAGERGVCGADDALVVARAALHFWEEPPISGSRGSGTVFFAHCPLRCCYCQNAVIAAGQAGRAVDVGRLAEMLLELEAQGALNVNFVTPTHYAPQARAAVSQARGRGLALPVVWNTSGYETVAAVQANAGTVDAYLADFKYADPSLAARYSKAPDYPDVALAALDEMARQTGAPEFDEVDGDPRLVRGTVVRHLMPGALEDSKRVVRLVHERFGDDVLLSLMNQYTPVLAGPPPRATSAPRRRCVAPARARPPRAGRGLRALLDYADGLGRGGLLLAGRGGAAEESFIPPFDLTGV